MALPEEVWAQLAISIPKRNFKTAVARNRIKRQVREAYRLGKADFYKKLQVGGQPIALMLILVAREMPEYCDIEAAIGKMIRKFPG